MEDMQRLQVELEHLLTGGDAVAARFRERMTRGGLAREEDAGSHLCVYFAAYDAEGGKVFLIHHKKSNLWLFNGGHLDRGESIRRTLEREIGEEWGIEAEALVLRRPELLTITAVDNPGRACRMHFDVWHFVPVSPSFFAPDPAALAEEAYAWEWLELEEARNLVRDPGTLAGLDFIHKNLFVVTPYLKG